jgi:hypothetical protein
MIDSSKLALFLTAAVLLAVAPGPGMLYVLARSLAGGRREGVLSSLGTFVGGMVHVLAAAAGISVVLARSALAFAAVKYVGAAYLCWLGVRMILAARRDGDEIVVESLPRARKSFLARDRDGGPESEDGVILLVVHSAICESGGGTRVLAVSGVRSDLSDAEYVGGLGGHDVCLTLG